MTATLIQSLDLRKLLTLDAATCVLMGAALFAAPAPIGELLGLPTEFVRWAGIVLFPCALLMLIAAVPTSGQSALAWLVIVGNVGWAVASVLVAGVLFSPTAIGVLFVLAQAAVVAGLAFLEYKALPVPSHHRGIVNS